MSAAPGSASNAPQPARHDRDIILYDGDCGLCDKLVQFVLPRDPRARFLFAPLQSELARARLAAAGLPIDDLDTMVLIEPDRVSARSTAALRVLRKLRWPWPILYFLVLVPRCLRDPVYRFIALNRHRWFDRPATCGLPKPGWKDRFLS